ncbi:MAG TPA: hypothetical protein VMO26_00355 [Vicinamibacterales bacterium]|nr:hypothetical protein [Vicinamibacterales bacterium]
MSRDASVLRALHEYRRRLRASDLSAAVVASAAAAAVVLVGASGLGATPAMTRVVTIAVFAICAAAFSARSWRRWTMARVAAVVESGGRGLDNLVVTAEEMASGRGRRSHPVIEAEVAAAAVARLQAVSPTQVQPLARPFALGAGALAALLALLIGLPSAQGPGRTPIQDPDVPAEIAVLAAGDLRVVITPPPYARRESTTLLNPASVAALEGSRIRLEVARAVQTALVNLDGTTTAFTEEGERRGLDFTALDSRPLLVRFEAAGRSADRLVQLRVHPDGRPIVRIEQPAKDLIFAEATGEVAVAIAARDDVGLASLALRYTKVSGSGEIFAFEEGEWPVRIERAAAGDWTAHAELSLAALKLQDGDTLVYRAVARDARPGADPSLSDSFLIEIGRLAGVASTGFGLPEERDRQAISQQMLIIKTERLHADRTRLSPEAFVEQSRLLAIEQRMVKAEFEFMTGGVVEDEFEEAAHSHEIAEGRFENTGQIELITAIREMSRAEARLNTADTAQALVNERAALRALQRAFDRRRYLLRTLPERARIDLSRRLSGELDTARSSTHPPSATSADPFLDRAREILGELDAETSLPDGPALAARILAVDPASEDLQTAALQVAAARDTASFGSALRAAQRTIAGAMRARLAKVAPTEISRDPLAGRLVQELPGAPPQ